MPACSDRVSAWFPLIPPGYRARLDVCHAILENMSSLPGVARRPIADVSQSCNLSPCRVDGRVPTIATSARFMDYNSGELLRPEMLFAVHGFPHNKLKFGSLSWSQATDLIGNSMCVTSVMVVVAPCLQILGFLTAVPDGE